MPTETDPFAALASNDVSAGGNPGANSETPKLFGRIPHVPRAWSNPWARYSFAVGCFVISLMLRISLEPFMMPHERGLFLFVPAVVVSAFFGGVGAGAATAMLSLMAGWYFSMSPAHLIVPGATLGLAIYVAVFAIVIWLTNWATMATRQLQADKKKMDLLMTRERLLMRELQHRTKNLYAVVQSLIVQSLKEADSVAAAREILLGRILALSRADNRLGGNYMTGCSLKYLIRAELEPFCARYKTDGADFMLGRNVAENFALLLHELATNAIKYGALSTDEGMVELTWRMADTKKHNLKFSWKEVGGPKVKVPSGKGFGTTLIENVFAGHVEYQPNGLHYEADVPVS